MTVRPMRPDDLAAVAAIQQAQPMAARWNPADYLALEAYVAEIEATVAGFLAVQPLAPGEAEILNLAVDPALVRRGIGRALLAALPPRELYLEVRESNAPARAFYRALGFVESGRRRAYYSQPAEDAVLMRRPAPPTR